jgi:plastocyanin
MTNADSRVPHNISIAGLGTSPTCAGTCTAALSFVAPAPGNYTFLCTVHPFMTGVLTVR